MSRQIWPAVTVEQLARELPLEIEPRLALVELAREIRDNAGPRSRLWAFGWALETVLGPLGGPELAPILHGCVHTLDRADLDTARAMLGEVLDRVTPAADAALDAGLLPTNPRGVAFANALQLHLLHAAKVDVLVQLEALP